MPATEVASTGGLYYLVVAMAMRIYNCDYIGNSDYTTVAAFAVFVAATSVAVLMLQITFFIIKLLIVNITPFYSI